MAADDSYTAADERARAARRAGIQAKKDEQPANTARSYAAKQREWKARPPAGPPLRSLSHGSLYSWPDGELVTPDKLAAWLKEDILLRRVVPPQKKKPRARGLATAAVDLTEGSLLTRGTIDAYIAAVIELWRLQVAHGNSNTENPRGAAAGYLPDEWLRIQDLLLTGAAYTPQNLRTRVDLLFGHYYLLRGENRRKMELADLSLLDYPPSEGPTACGCLDWYRIKVLVGRDREQELSYPTQLQETWRIFGAAGLIASKKTHLPRRVGAQDAETHGTSLAQISQAGRWNQSVLCQAYLTHLPRQFMRIVAGFSASRGLLRACGSRTPGPEWDEFAVAVRSTAVGAMEPGGLDALLQGKVPITFTGYFGAGHAYRHSPGKGLYGGDVWKEWEEGVQFCRRKVIWDELLARMASGKCKEAAVAELELLRAGRSLNRLVDELKQRRRRGQDRGQGQGQIRVQLEVRAVGGGGPGWESGPPLVDAVITYAAKYCSKSEKKTEPYCKLADQVLPHTAHHQPLLSFSSRLMNKLIAERDYSAQEISHLLLNIPLQEGTRMVVYVDCRPLEQHARSYRVDEDSYNLKRWRRLGANAKKRVLSYFPRYRSAEASPQFHDFCRVKLMMAHPHRSPEELLAVDGQRFESFAAAYQCCRQRHHFHEDDHYGVGANELQAEDDEFEREEHEEPVVEEDWHELARMLPDHPLEEDDIDVLGRRDVDVNYDWTSHVGRYTDDGILHGDFWKQRKAENPLHLDVDHQPLEARDSLNPEQRLVYDTVMGHFLTQACSQLLLHVDGGGGTGKSYLINLLSEHLQAASGGRGTPVWRAAPTGVAGNQISGTTLHSLLHLPINKDFKPLSAIDKAQLQKKLKNVKYLIVDEKSMLGLRQLSWIDDRLREAFPNRNEEFFGGLNILLVGDFFQLPPVLQKPLYYDKEVQGVEIKGRNAYRRFDKTVFLKVAQRQRGDDQGAFRSALEELRLLQLSMESWKLLSSRVQAKLDDQEVARFVNSLRVYATKDRVMAKNVGPDAAAAPDDKPVGLCNGARDPPCVIMMEFDKYTGPVFLTTSDGRKIVPILPVNRDFLVGSTLCTRTQFPLIVCYAITVHKSQSITEDMIVTDLSCRDFQTGLSYVAVSRVKTLQGLMLDAPFDRNHLTYASPPEGIKMKMRDQQLRKRQVLVHNPYKIGHGPT
ncbi:PIF1-like helicase domain-containing protein [Hirsutella rhossiliensis]|uniref:ATP-dependent DNA helicase n=1 Tax=Hirsutella rhossiliensis TaxID=111463 RepID=A0A9P8MKX2_9HYPO|nr:PIF1-like helicase domain-containing protein [Hirsutella rhossiliensis]KAH0957212.1 PIF1-like helicase domain-containing protein [Hirsutella rhossiliensis]